ncbi:MAG: sensor histidine kinase [Kofleriaceae bacterium]
MSDAAPNVAGGDTRLRILAEVSHALAAITTDHPQVLKTIAETCARLVGDGCSVTLLDAERHYLVGVANAHREIDLEGVFREFVMLSGGVASGDTVSARVVRSGEPVFVPRIDPAILAARFAPDVRPVVERLGVNSLIVVPIRAHNTIIGTLSMIRTGTDPDYEPDDVVLLQDLADRAGLAIDNARLYKELELRVRQRTSELEAFSFAVAHSIRAPLRSIAAFSDAIYEDAYDRLEPHSREDLARIRVAIVRVRETVDSLLHLAKLTSTELRRSSVDVSALATDVVQRLRGADPARVVEVAIEPGLEVHADPRLVELAVSALLSNAWSTTRGRSDGKIAVAGRDNASAIAIHDNGNLALPQARALLARDSTSRPPPSGDFGVGIVIARQVIERHGGTIEIEAHELGGTCVWFTLSGA